MDLYYVLSARVCFGIIEHTFKTWKDHGNRAPASRSTIYCDDFNKKLCYIIIILSIYYCDTDS